MRYEDIVWEPSKFLKKFGRTDIQCPYHKGKFIITTYRKKTIETIQNIIESLSSYIGDRNYDDIREQFNTEKELEYNLTHDIVKERTNLAYQYHQGKRSKTTIDSLDLLKFSQQDPAIIEYKISRKFNDINEYIKTYHSDIYDNAKRYSDSKKELSKKGIRKATQSSKSGFDSIEDNSGQLILHTIYYLQYLYDKNSNNLLYTYDMSVAKTPKSFYFLSSFSLTTFQHIVEDVLKDYRTNGKLVDFYDDNDKFWISSEALQDINSAIESFKEKTPNFAHLIQQKDLCDFFLPDENTYWCPVKDSFTKLYQIILTSIVED